MFGKILLNVVFVVIAGFAMDLQAQPEIFIVNLKSCLVADPEAAEQDSCPPGAPSPWTSCPTGRCGLSQGDACIIPDQNISFTQLTHFTNGFYFNPPEVGPDEPGKGAVEVDRMLCSYFRACPCKTLPNGARACTMVEYTEEWLIKYERSNLVLCVGAPLAPLTP
jgi:hypothetical protein